MINNRKKYRECWSIFCISLIIILLTSVYIPAISGADLSGAMGDEMNISGSLSLDGKENFESEPQENMGVGIFWWMHGDETLANTREDTRGFANYLASKGFRKDFDINEDAFTKWKLTDGWFGQDQNYFEQTDFVYFAGHGNHHCIGVNNFGNPLTSVAYYWECLWGDEGPVKWVGLASCYNTQNEFKTSMNGIHLILGWSTWCDDKQFGETLAKHCTDDEMSIKESWFATAIEKSTTRNLEAKIMGENSAAGNDCIYSGGEIVEDLEVTNQITYWKCPVNHFPAIYGLPPVGGSTTQGSSTQSSSTQSSSSSSSSSSSTQSSQASSTTGTTLNVRGDTSIAPAYESLSSSLSYDTFDDMNTQYDGEDIYYFETNDTSVAFPTIVLSEGDVYSSEAPDLSYEKVNWKSMAKQYMADKGLLTDEDAEGVNYYMNMVPQKQGFSYKKTAQELLDQNEYFEEWDIALNVFIIKKLDGDIELPPIPDGENIVIENTETGSTSTTYLRGDLGMESEEMNSAIVSGMYQKTTLVISQDKKIGYSFTRIGSYNEDEYDTGGDNEP